MYIWEILSVFIDEGEDVQYDKLVEWIEGLKKRSNKYLIRIYLLFVTLFFGFILLCQIY